MEDLEVLNLAHLPMMKRHFFGRGRSWGYQITLFEERVQMKERK